jgi:phosphate transport system substrate-binding protein
MKTYRQGLTIVCSQCNYPDNDRDRQSCEMCGAPLSIDNSYRSPSKEGRFKLSKRYALLALILVSAGGFLYKTQLSDTRGDRGQISFNSIFQQLPSMKEVSGVPQGLFDYAGATTFAAVNSQLNQAIEKNYPDFELRYKEPRDGTPGGSAGIKMLLNGEIAFAQSGRPFKQEEYDIAKSRGLTLKQVPVAIDGIVFFVNPALNLEGLPLNRLREIFSGRITNWKQVGGPDLPIVPISTNPKSHVILPIIMGVEQPTIGKNVKIVRDYTSAIRQTAATPGAIAFASAAIIQNQRSIEPLALAKGDSQDFVAPFTSNSQVDINAFRSSKYPLTRRLFVAYRLDGTPEEKAAVAYANLLMTAQGQQIFKEAGFAPLYGKYD